MPTDFPTFPKSFVWGCATASYQIEGAHDADGKGESIWDRFAHTPGKITDGSTGDVACDHYHLYHTDVDLMRRLGLQAYRFSVSWPRVYPTGQGQVNPAGIDFYDRLVDALLAAGIDPYVTLYHWDLPQTLQDQGGWANRDTIGYFRDYAETVGRRLGDRVKNWITHNEPWVVAFLGNYDGVHAPGLQDLALAMQVAHNVLVSHGEAVRALRATGGPDRKVGITLNLSPMYPASDSAMDIAATLRQDGALNRLFLDPLFLGKYPEDIVALLGPAGPRVQPGDMDLIRQPIDFLGINNYTRMVVRHQPGGNAIHTAEAPPRGPGHQYTAMDWEVFPDGLYEILTRVKRDYPAIPLYVTENGAAFDDRLDDGRVDDLDRVTYLRGYTAACARAIADGVPLKGYFCWSLTDNFEWGFGFSRRFGIVYVDFATQRRVVKASGYWYRELIESSR
jgi:beta-glucosidase